MCKFFSCVSDGKGMIYYFDWEMRKKIIDGKLNDNYECDSHSSICNHFKLNCDKVNKYEYNPLLKEFKIDQINNKDDSKMVEKKLRKLDFKNIVPQLKIKEIIHPFKLKKQKPKRGAILALKQWSSVGASVVDSVGASVGASVGDSVRLSVDASVWDSVWSSVVDSVGASVWPSAAASVGAYTSSFVDLERNQWKYTENIKTKDKNPFSPCIKLWEHGLVPSFDGKIWRLHSGKDADVVFEISKEDLEKYV